MWFLSRICEEFNCLPSAAIQEWEDQPAGLLESIIDMRAYAAAHRIYRSPGFKPDHLSTAMHQLLLEIDTADLTEE